MILLTDTIPAVSEPRAEWIRLYSVFLCYPEDALFWVQDDGRAYICYIDGDMTVLNLCADTEELAEFVSVISPNSIFSDEKTLLKLGLNNLKTVNVMAKSSELSGTPSGDVPNSRKIYDIFKLSGLTVGQYEFFAVDFCCRLNHGHATCFFKENECAAYAVTADNFALIQGIASLKKGCGRTALNAIMQKNYGRTVLACCEENVIEFYQKNDFKRLYNAAYWMR